MPPKTVHKVFCNNYIKTLVGSDLDRYNNKIKNLCHNIDPYEVRIAALSSNIELWPKITHVDIVNYLCLTTSHVTLCQMKAYKSLEAHNFFTSGFVHPSLSLELPDKNILLFGTVNHSQSLREVPLKPWILAKPTGEIVTAHCNCMAGRGEVCSHIAAVLFAVEYATTLRDSTTCTSKLNGWLPPTLKTVPYLPIKEVDFSSKDAKKRSLAQQATVGLPVNTLTLQPRPKKNKVPTPTVEDISTFLGQVAAVCDQSSILRVVPGYCDAFVPTESTLPQPLICLANEALSSLPFHLLLQHCDNLFNNLRLTQEEADAIEVKSREQANSVEWFSQRAGRITASKMKTACHTDPADPSVSLIKSVCYPEAHRFTSKATSWGCQHEEEARVAYQSSIEKSHEGVNVSLCGFFVNPLFPHIGASPDGLVECLCCGKGLIEVKCPFSHCNNAVTDIVADKTSCLVKDVGDGIRLDRKHAYFYQVQTQLAVCGADYCDFCVWTQKDLYIERILPDLEFISLIIDKATNLFKVAILPELTAKFFSTTRHAGLELPSVNSLLVCYCREAEEEPMLTCSNLACAFKKFHWRCLRIKVTPRTKRWFCLECKKVGLQARKKASTSLKSV